MRPGLPLEGGRGGISDAGMREVVQVSLAETVRLGCADVLSDSFQSLQSMELEVISDNRGMEKSLQTHVCVCVCVCV